MNLLVTLLALFLVASAQASELHELMRPLREASNPWQEYSLTRIQYEGTFAEGYIYSDLLTNENSKDLTAKITEAVRYFDAMVYPKYIEIFRLGEMAQYHRKHKIALIFDDKLGYEAFHSNSLRERYNRDFILVNIGTNLNSNDLRYHFPHELQHIVRWHYNPQEAHWLNEGLSVFATYQITQEFPEDYLNHYKHLLGLSLQHTFDGHADSANYFNSFLYVFYLYRHYGGDDLIRNLMVSSRSGEVNIQSSLSALSLKEKGLSKRKLNGKSEKSVRKSELNFASTFLNYQLALVMNPVRNEFESDGYFDLGLQRTGIPAQLTNYRSEPGRPRLNQPLSLGPLASDYYLLEKKCYRILMSSSDRLMLLFIDLYARKEMQVIQVMKPGETYCLDEVKLDGQYLLVINLNNAKTNKYRLSVEGDANSSL